MILFLFFCIFLIVNKIQGTSNICEFTGEFHLDINSLVDFYIDNSVLETINTKPIAKIASDFSDKFKNLDGNSKHTFVTYMHCFNEKKETIDNMDEILQPKIIKYIFSEQMCKFILSILNCDTKKKIIKDLIKIDHIKINEILYYIKKISQYENQKLLFNSLFRKKIEIKNKIIQIIKKFASLQKTYIDIKEFKDEIIIKILEFEEFNNKDIFFKQTVKCVFKKCYDLDEIKIYIENINYKNFPTHSAVIHLNNKSHITKISHFDEKENLMVMWFVLVACIIIFALISLLTFIYIRYKKRKLVIMPMLM